MAFCMWIAYFLSLNFLATSGRCLQMAGDGGKDGGGSSGQGQGLWKLEVARQVLAEDYGPRLDWVTVAKALDHERFIIPDQVRLFGSCFFCLVFW